MNNPLEDEEEKKSFLRILAAFKYYKLENGHIPESSIGDMSALVSKSALITLSYLFYHMLRVPLALLRNILFYFFTRRSTTSKGNPHVIFFSEQLTLNNAIDLIGNVLFTTYSLLKVKKNEQYLETLPVKHQHLLSKYKDHLNDLKTCIDRNYEIIKLIIKDVGVMFENVPSSEPIKLISPLPNSTDLEKVQTTLKQFVRDWSEEGTEERRTCYDPIIYEILDRFSPKKVNPKDIKILVPGAGLGRLAFEIARRGYSCQGNEFSLFMLFASNFILNKCRERNIYKIYPWVQQTDNNIMTHHQTTAVTFPDINTTDSEHRDFSMAAGDFLQVYVTPNEWNCVATCFFIDCANNIVSFIETIYNILKPGGIWINLGPLLYHYSNMLNEDSIEPSYEVVREVILGFGFVFEKESLNVKTKYAQNPYSMLQYEYKSVFFVCRKPDEGH